MLASNAFKATKQMCSMVRSGNGRLFALIVSHPPNAPTSAPYSISYVAAHYGIPVIGKPCYILCILIVST